MAVVPHRRKAPAPNHTAGTKKTKTVSASAIFNTKAPTAVAHPKVAKSAHTSNVPAENGSHPKQTENTLPPTATASCDPKKCRPGEQSVDAEFKEATAAYRAHLFNSAIAQIDARYEGMIEALQAIGVQPLLSVGVETDSSPPMLSVADRVKYATGRLYQSVGSAILSLPTVNVDGKRVQQELELSERIKMFAEHIEREELALRKLQKDWERVTAEIWKCGESILGAEGMKEFLVEEKSASKKKTRDMDEESTLFVPERSEDTESAVATYAGKENVLKDVLPAFLKTPSRMAKLAVAPEIPPEQIGEIHEVITNLGAKQVEDLRRLYKDQDKWYKTKNKKMIEVLKADD